VKKLGLILILIIAFSIIPANAIDLQAAKHIFDQEIKPVSVTETDSSFIVDGGSHIEYFKGSTGYDMIKTPSGETMVASQRWTVEYLSGTKWKQVGIPYEVTHTQMKESVEVSRHYTDYASTEIEVKAKTNPELGTKTDIIITSGEDRFYRIVWNLDGINNELVSYDDNSVTFTSSTDWITIDWSDAFNQYGDITDFEVSDTAGGKKLEVIFNVGLIKQGESLTLDPKLIDSYTSGGGNVSLRDFHPSAAGNSAAGQWFNVSVTVVGYNISTAQFSLKKVGNPTGNAHAVLYNATGTPGVNGTPTGAALATSNNFDVSTLTGGYVWKTFTFSGVNKVPLQNGTNYFIVYQNPTVGTIDNANYVDFQADSTAPTHYGNLVTWGLAQWISSAANDGMFRVYATIPDPQIKGFTATTTFSLNQPGWVNVTVQDDDGVANINTVTIQVNTTSDAENFTLRWTQAGDAFTEILDPDNICTLNPESVRANINVTHDIISFNFNITGGQSGLCDVLVTVIDDGALSDIELFVSAFTFSYFNWNPTADLVDSAFEQFGIIGYLTTITTWISGLVTKFESSLTRILALVLLQFTVIEQVYAFFTGWATDLFATALTFSTFYHQIMDGTSPWIQPIYAIGNFWDLIGYDSWAPAVPMLLFIWWLNSMPKRAAQTVGGEFQVFLNDINTAIGLISYFVSIFSYVANAIIDRVYGLFPAIT